VPACRIHLLSVDPDPAYQITISVEHHAEGISESNLRRAVQVTLAHHKIAAGQVDVAIVSDEEMARLNEAHLDHTGPTDVLTFDLCDEADESAIDGQIIMSLDTAKREADARGHSLEAELALYAVHGTLHLLGYDDQTPAEAAAMHELEDKLLKQMGIGPVFGCDASADR